MRSVAVVTLVALGCSSSSGFNGPIDASPARDAAIDAPPDAPLADARPVPDAAPPDAVPPAPPSM